jgi:uncharacterized membrane protein
MGTVMAANVKIKIVPAQRAQVEAVERGELPPVSLSQQAKVRSIHNNYLTFPVIVLMVSSHFPSFYGHDRGWMVLAVLLLGGAAVRHLLNIRFTYRHWKPALATTIAVGVGALYGLGALHTQRRATTSVAATSDAASFEDVQNIIQRRCTVCHATAPAIRTFGIAPGGVTFEQPQDIRALAPRIEARAVTTQTMPPANATFMTDAEREVLARWIREQRD